MWSSLTAPRQLSQHDGLGGGDEAAGARAMVGGTGEGQRQHGVAVLNQVNPLS